MSQAPTAERFDDITIFTTEDVSLHLKNFISERELEEMAVAEEFSATAGDGKNYRMKFYSLEAIAQWIALTGQSSPTFVTNHHR